MSSAESHPRSERTNLVVGFVTLAVVAAILFFGGRAIYRWFVPVDPPGRIALSAYFEPVTAGPAGASALRIEGQVQQKGAPVRDGQVHVTVNRLNGDLRQSLLLKLDADGKFVVANSPALSSLRPNDRLYVEAEASAGEKVVASEVVYLKARKPLVARDKLLAGGLVLFVAMLTAFLMAFTGGESPNRNRLAVSFSYVVIVLFFALPLAAPIVLSQAYPDLQMVMEETPVGLVHGVVKDKDNASPPAQWYLNIGGVVQANEATPEASAEIVGGLAIPFYVLVLATIGGVINMTRKVPDSQDDAESSVLNLFGVGSSVRGFFRRAAAKPGEPAAREEEPPPARKPRPAAGREVSPEWRTDLVKQYMYLVSAPFLGIVTYYLLIWLDMKQTPVVVLVSFSVGLISDSIVERIIEVVGGFLRRPAKDKKNKGAAGDEATA